MPRSCRCHIWLPIVTPTVTFVNAHHAALTTACTPAASKLVATVYHETIPARTASVPAARQHIASLLGALPFKDDALLCFSEILANAVLHSNSRESGGKVRISASIQAGHFRAEITDQGGTWKAATDANDDSGRGLRIVQALSSQWGVTGNQTERTVWFSIYQPA